MPRSVGGVALVVGLCYGRVFFVTAGGQLLILEEPSSEEMWRLWACITVTSPHG